MAQKVPASLPGDTVPLKESLLKISKKVHSPQKIYQFKIFQPP